MESRIVKLKKLLEEIDYEMVKGSKGITINGVCSHSKRVSPGDLYLAIRGGSFDGTQYIPEALDAGASAILTDIYNPFLKNVVQIIHKDVRSIEPKIASCFYDYPSSKLFTMGVTGTNGKTTIAYMIRHLLGRACGLMGTIETIIGDHHLTAELTTPDSVTCQKLLYEMVKSGCSSAVMEVSSHGLMQNRVDEVQFDVAIFSNLSLDHLDYHGTMEEYAEAKSRLFQLAPNAILNIDDPWSKKMHPKGIVFTYALDQKADLRATEIALGEKGMQFILEYKGKSYPVVAPLVGRFNVYNLLAAFSALLVKGERIENLIHRIQSFSAAPGRMQRVISTRPFDLYVDFAHSPDALESALKTLREIAQKRIITVFGCGGQRDVEKRPLMMDIAEKYSDQVIVTNDNPRNEDPMQIAKEILNGRKGVIELDRRKAIEMAIAMAQPGDLILVAGKGHESRQIIADRSYPFNDYAIATELLN
ncbi:MAG: UDP-N-acetylmuramoyl-L-alanyl-D-glutamate--2,6-diaminopimelate ligase [Simkaniaceae bacterium]|nr:UDP-N-acetylmuramoyl-L-alanyl-D-glutamate--2,6-diaminopimelate ligase [Simkaniaceae bacterium]